MSELPEPPSEFHPRWKSQTGVAVLTRGLPGLPAQLDYGMSLPVASWTATSCAVVLFLEFAKDGGEIWPRAHMMTYARVGSRWTAHRYQGGVGWSHDPIANPRDARDLGGRMIVKGGGSFTDHPAPDHPAPGHPAAVLTGRVAPGVTGIGFSQEGAEEWRALRSHFGAWVVCTERWSPYRVTALAGDGSEVGTVEGPPRLPPRPSTTLGRHPGKA